MMPSFPNSLSYSVLNTDSASETPVISTMTSGEMHKSNAVTTEITEITSKAEKSPTAVAATGNSSSPSTETEEEKAKRLLYCSLCKVAVNSASQLEAHNSGEMLAFPFYLNSSTITFL